DKETEFTGIPLQTRMMAEVFESGTDDETRLREYLSCGNNSRTFFPNNQINLVDLYKKFIKNKFYINYKEKRKIDTNNPLAQQTLEQEYKSFKIDHQKLALFLLFNKRDIQILLGLNNEQGCIRVLEELRGRVEINGIIKSIKYGLPVFVHKTFAEYLV